MCLTSIVGDIRLVGTVLNEIHLTVTARVESWWKGLGSFLAVRRLVVLCEVPACLIQGA